jgi:hypothetical protein
MGFNRNIITRADITNLVTPGALAPKTLGTDPPAGYVPPAAPGAAALAAPAPAAPAPAASVPIPTEDGYLTRLLKYVPVEVLGAYLFMATVIDSNVTGNLRAYWLGGLLAAVLLLTIPYDYLVLNVVRPEQIAMSVLGLAVYVFSIGGWFATTTWYHQWYASIAVAMFALLVGIIKVRPLPETSPAGG